MVRASIQVPIRSGQGPWFSVGFDVFGRFCLAPGRLSYFFRPYFRVCVLVAVLLSTEILPVSLLEFQDVSSNIRGSMPPGIQTWGLGLITAPRVIFTNF